MPFPARVFRVLIASPSDVVEEREIAVRTIQEWNDLNAAERQVVMLPLRWETHAAPEFGRPQDIINRQVVDGCDLLVGIFWTRVGSPTDIAISGTVEEIERVAVDGKPIMLYFSRARQDPDEIDLDQLRALRDFKQKTFPSALIETYGTLVEFKDKLARQLEMQLRSLIAAETSETLGDLSRQPITAVSIHFADAGTGADNGTELTLSTKNYSVTDFDRIPDYTDPKEPAAPIATTQESTAASLLYATSFSQPNKDYFRQLVTYQILTNFFAPLRFWLKNRGGVGAKDVHVDIEVRTDAHSGVVVLPLDQLPTAPPTRSGSTLLAFGAHRHYASPRELIERERSGWTFSFELPALQPQREVSPPPQLVIGATQSTDVLVRTRTFADTLAEPTEEELKLHLVVHTAPVEADDVIRELTSEPRS